MTFGLISKGRFDCRPSDLVKVTTSMQTMRGLWLVDQVQFDLLQSSVVEVTCGRIVDPRPETPTETIGDYKTNGPATGGVTFGLRDDQ